MRGKVTSASCDRRLYYLGVVITNINYFPMSCSMIQYVQEYIFIFTVPYSDPTIDFSTLTNNYISWMLNITKHNVLNKARTEMHLFMPI